MTEGKVGNEKGEARFTRPEGEGERPVTISSERAREHDNSWRWRTTKEASAKDENKQKGGSRSQGERRENFHRLFFHFFSSPSTRRCGHLYDTLSSLANMSSRNITVQDEKEWLWPGFLKACWGHKLFKSHLSFCLRAGFRGLDGWSQILVQKSGSFYFKKYNKT